MAPHLAPLTPAQATLSTRVPSLTAKAVPALFSRLLSTYASRPRLRPSSPASSSAPNAPLQASLSLGPHSEANSLDWFIHTGGSLILSTLSKTLHLLPPTEDPSQTAPSWQMYRERGNSSSASIGGVIERGRAIGGREGVVSVAFGPGMTVEMVLLRRRPWKGRAAAAGKVEAQGGGEVVGGRDLEEKAEAVVREASGVEGQQANGIETVANGIEVLPKLQVGRTVTEVEAAKGHACVCVFPSSRFGGSGLDCWCRN